MSQKEADADSIVLPVLLIMLGTKLEKSHSLMPQSRKGSEMVVTTFGIYSIGDIDQLVIAFIKRFMGVFYTAYTFFS